MKKNRLIAMALCLALTLGLAACGGQKDPEPTPSAQPSAAPEVSVEPSAEPVKETVRFAVLSGPTGVGAAKLLADNEEEKTLNQYEVTVATDNSEISGKLINGELDIACMASNVAANLYNKTKGGVQALCLSTLGVLYILERHETGAELSLKSVADLKGKTIYATGQGANPEFVLNHILTENGIDPAADVEIVWKTAAEVQAAMLSGEADVAMLPVPAATVVQIKSKQSETHRVSSALDLTEEWNKVSPDSVLTMTTVVVRSEFAQEHPEAVEKFLTEYAASIDYVNGNVEEASALLEKFTLVPSAAIGKMAIPDCNLVFVTGSEMSTQIEGYYQVLFEADPSSVGGSVPDSGFYYMGK